MTFASYLGIVMALWNEEVRDFHKAVHLQASHDRTIIGR